MDPNTRIGAALRSSMGRATSSACPPGLAAAMDHAVFPGGHRVRPRLALAVALAQGRGDGPVVDAALVSIELLHCASLVHDDMPCFDDAPMRRGKPTVHLAYGEPLALLCGDALIVLAFQELGRAALVAPRRAARVLNIISEGVGAPGGIVAGQSWECEAEAPAREYQRAKTGSLFAAATMAGAAAAGADPAPWRELGECIGEAYQIADDLLDHCGDPAVIGKPIGQDLLLGRPNAVRRLGVEGASSRLKGVIERAVHSLPPCPGEDGLRTLIRKEAGRFMELALNGRAAA